MLAFDDTFFQKEIRNDFEVLPMMKRCWAAQLEVLQEIDKVCNQLGITYFADWGTLLGTVRHQGFVPWDDDLDICMKRPDYIKFMLHAKEMLPKDFLLLHVSTTTEITNMLCRITNGCEIRMDEDTLKRFHGFPYVVGIDIFPIDYIPRDEEAVAFQKDVVQIINETINLMENPSLEGEEKEEAQAAITEFLQMIETLCEVNIDREGNIKNQLLQLMDKVIGLFQEEESDYVASMCDYLNGWNPYGLEYKIPKESYDEVVMMPFETIEMPVPKGYDYILRVKYGDYEIPVYDGTNHEYPFYRAQEEILRKYLQTNHLSGQSFDLD